MECSAMGCKYLGDKFDIHGGGMDLLFPHHESEIAQVNAAKGHDSVKYWMHNNMITVNGQKMGKSLNNFIILDEFFSGENPALEQAYSPMTIRFFMLQAHYRSTLDFSNEALKAAEKGMSKLVSSYQLLNQLEAAEKSTIEVRQFENLCADAINDDFNTPIVLAHLFDLARIINTVNDKKEKLSKEDIDWIKNLFNDYLFDILGIEEEKQADDSQLVDYLMQTILGIRQEAKKNKDYSTSDRIREELDKLNIQIKDTKEGVRWEFKG